jgi:hypothetical protein
MDWVFVVCHEAGDRGESALLIIKMNNQNNLDPLGLVAQAKSSAQQNQKTQQ